MTDERFWDVIEAAWAPLGAEVAAARRALTTRDLSADVWEMTEICVVDKALDAFLGNLAVVVHQVRAHDATTLQQTPPVPATGHETVPALGAVHAAERTEGTR